MNTPDAEAVPSSNNSATSLSPQPPDVESKLEIRGVGSNAPITRLPKEVLNRIIRGMIAADIYGVALPFDIAWKDFRVRADLASCSRVCRQWRQIALPYLFHHFDLVFFEGESWTHDALEDRSDDKYNLFTFLSKAPTIAPLIHELLIVSSVLPLSAISCMLTLLPKLQSVQIMNTSVIGYDKCVDRGKTFHINCIDYTAHRQNDRSDDYVVTVLELLTLFSEIGTLYLADVGVSDDFGGDSWDPEDKEKRHEYVDHSSRIVDALEQIVDQGLVIRGIRLRHSEYMRFHRDVICSHPDILLHVVCLELAGVIFPDTYDDIISLLSILRPRLRELTICFQSSVEISYYTEGRLRMIPTCECLSEYYAVASADKYQKGEKISMSCSGSNLYHVHPSMRCDSLCAVQLSLVEPKIPNDAQLPNLRLQTGNS